MATAMTHRFGDGRQAPSGQGNTIRHVNLGESERIASAVGGAALAITGLARGTLGGFALAALGGSLLYRGLTGYCSMYDALGWSSTDERRGPMASVKAQRGVRVDETIRIGRPPEDLYDFWRNLENLPRFMSHLLAVRDLGHNRSHWVARAPAGRVVEWDAEIINERRPELIAWRSLPGSDVDNAGSVHFRRAPDGVGTEVRVELKYDPPAGRLGALVSWLFGEEPNLQVQEDLRRLKRVVEGAGERAT